MKNDLDKQPGDGQPGDEKEAPEEKKAVDDKELHSEEKKAQPHKRESLYAKNDPDLLVTYKPIEGEPATVKCPHCGEEMPTTIDTCVNCGHYLKEDKRPAYTPMSKEKIKKIRWIVGIVCIVAFILFWVFFKK